MVEITVRDALSADVPFLRDALAKLNDNTPMSCRHIVARASLPCFSRRPRPKCRAWGATGVHLGFIEGNIAAEAAYRKAGYVCDEAVHAAISGLNVAAIGTLGQATPSHVRYINCALQYLRQSV